jgi:acyl-CoA synthetase (NDP forming)
MPGYEADTVKKIRTLVAPEIVIRNPIDAGDPAGDTNAAAICRAIVADPNVHMLAWAGQAPVGPHNRDPAIIRGVFDATDKPVICFSRLHHRVDDHSIAFQERSGVPFLQDISSSFRAISALAFYGMRSGRRVPPLKEPHGARVDLVGSVFEDRLKACGLTPPVSEMVGSPEQAAKAAERIGFSVALKIISPQFTHKTEIGGVRLNLRTSEEVEREARELARTLKGIAPDAHIEGFLVQEMVNGPELLLGARTDPLYGPVIVVSAGGTLVELQNDKAFRLLPVDEDGALAMVNELVITKSFGGYRNMPRRDIDATAKAICGLSDLFMDVRHIATDIEINPLIVLPEGQGVRAVDVRVIFRDSADAVS